MHEPTAIDTSEKWYTTSIGSVSVGSCPHCGSDIRVVVSIGGDIARLTDCGCNPPESSLWSLKSNLDTPRMLGRKLENYMNLWLSISSALRGITQPLRWLITMTPQLSFRKNCTSWITSIRSRLVSFMCIFLGKDF